MPKRKTRTKVRSQRRVRVKCEKCKGKGYFYVSYGIYEEYQPTGGYGRLKMSCQDCKGMGYEDRELYHA